MKHVLSADLEMLPMTKERDIPLKMGRYKQIATKLKPVQMSNECNNSLIEVRFQRDTLE